MTKTQVVDEFTFKHELSRVVDEARVWHETLEHKCDTKSNLGVNWKSLNLGVEKNWGTSRKEWRKGLKIKLKID